MSVRVKSIALLLVLFIVAGGVGEAGFSMVSQNSARQRASNGAASSKKLASDATALASATLAQNQQVRAKLTSAQQLYLDLLAQLAVAGVAPNKAVLADMQTLVASPIPSP